jgi:hypothetical protein
MTQRSPEKLREVVEMIASGVLSPRKASRACGVPPSTYWDWVSAAQRDPSDERYILEYCGEWMPFHKAVALARKVALAEALGRFETRCLEGDETPVFYQGRPMWIEDESLSHLSNDDLERLGIPDRYLRVNGKRVQHTIKSAPPVAAVIKLLESNFKSYAPRSEVTVNARHSGGVSVVNVPKILPAVEIVQPPPQIAPPTSTYVEVEEPTAAHAAPDEEPIAEEPTAAHAAVEPRRPISALERDLLARLKQGPTNPRPSAPVNVGKPSDEY